MVAGVCHVVCLGVKHLTHKECSDCSSLVPVSVQLIAHPARLQETCSTVREPTKAAGFCLLLFVFGCLEPSTSQGSFVFPTKVNSYVGFRREALLVV